ncbi:MAG: hypothetical protein HQK79_11210 [Desulfobacterales bacterium]|nr:hypothetical protein [Desulfobacterales bacterium]
MEEIIRADKNLQKKFIVIMLSIVFICSYIIYNINSYLQNILLFKTPEIAIIQIKNILVILSVINAIISLGFAVYFILLSIKTFKFNRFPPIGMRVIRDTNVQTGKKAIRTGTSLIVIAILILSTNLCIWYIRIFIYSMLDKYLK